MLHWFFFGFITILSSFFLMIIISWNCHGEGNNTFKRIIKSIINEHKLGGILVLMETHIAGSKVKKMSKSLGYNSVVHVDPNGFLGGIWVLWNRDSINVTIHELQDQFIHFQV